MLDKISVKINPQPVMQYNILLGSGILRDVLTYLPISNDCSKLVIITDSIIAQLYVESLQLQFKQAGFETLLLIVAPGEGAKSVKVKEKLDLALLKNKCDRKTILVALGGGVIGDLTGFVAATYMRGVRFIQIPTTVLAAIDSSVGGKTGLNTRYGKNLIGAIWQPIAVITDIQMFHTLPQIHLVNGLIEAIKIFITSDFASFSHLNTNIDKILKRDEPLLQSIIQRAIKLKAHIVEQDEREDNLRMILNFGHTVGHALEKDSNYEILHGLCVGLGILVETKIAVLLNKLSSNDFALITNLLGKIGINCEMLAKFSIDKIIKHMLLDKKNRDAQIHMVIITNIGKVYQQHERMVMPIPLDLIKDAFKELSGYNNEL